ncbi:VanZ like family protein [Salegentibacter salinarum]|uniref:VanZ family protein n=1 Tax=Salegentibacter salinarum TaxID=447422 RepID=UPI0009D61396|nr:VanZ family protein [Salegentibacter salinarum]SKB47886.1 VanZ like family protein [Salegentibacter salinarum]
MPIKKFLVAKIILFVASFYTILLTVSSLVKLGKISVGSFNPTDKLLHLGAYFGLVVLWKVYFMQKNKPRTTYKINLFKIAGLSILFGMLIEVLQGVVTSYREPDWYDILANTAGILLAVIIFLLFEKSLKRLNSKINLIF